MENLCEMAETRISQYWYLDFFFFFPEHAYQRKHAFPQFSLKFTSLHLLKILSLLGSDPSPPLMQIYQVQQFTYLMYLHMVTVTDNFKHIPRQKTGTFGMCEVMYAQCNIFSQDFVAPFYLFSFQLLVSPTDKGFSCLLRCQ